MGDVFVGSAARHSGRLSEHRLRTEYRSMFPDVYMSRADAPTLEDRTFGAWVWSSRRATVAGLAAAALHGSNWIDDDVPIELVWRNTHPPSGVVARNDRLGDDEITEVAGIRVTTPARTAFDLGRLLPRDEAVPRLDALMRASPFSTEDVLLLVKRYGGARGVRRLRAALPLVDSGAASPRETWLRLVLLDAGLPPPTTQFVVVGPNSFVAELDLAWEDYRVAAEYDGDHHRSDRRHYVKDQRRLRMLDRLGWIIVRVINEDSADDARDRVLDALRRREFPRH